MAADEEEEYLGTLEAVLDGCGGFEGIEEFGIVMDQEAPWTYDAEARALTVPIVANDAVVAGVLMLDRRYVKATWREVKQVMKTRFRRDDDGVASAACVMLSGDAYSAWNSRKRRLKRAWTEDARRQELAFCALVLRRHPKAASAWSHRRWCLGGAPEAMVAGELGLCATLAERYPRNYMAWTHRAWLSTEFPFLDLAAELAFVRGWLERHVADYSAASYAVFVAAKLDASALEGLLELRAKLAAAYPHLAVSTTGALAYLQRSAVFALGHHRPVALSTTHLTTHPAVGHAAVPGRGRHTTE